MRRSVPTLGSVLTARLVRYVARKAKRCVFSDCGDLST
jgi:hypothetical protein